MKDFTNEERAELMDQFVHAAELLSRMPEMSLSVETRELLCGHIACTICVWDDRASRGRGAMLDLDKKKAKKCERASDMLKLLIPWV